MGLCHAASLSVEVREISFDLKFKLYNQILKLPKKCSNQSLERFAITTQGVSNDKIQYTYEYAINITLSHTEGHLDSSGICRDDHIICHNGGSCEINAITSRAYCRCGIGFEGIFCEAGNFIFYCNYVSKNGSVKNIVIVNINDFLHI